MTPDQTSFTAALLDPALDVPKGLSDGQNHPAGRRFYVYRNNVAASLTDALNKGFPVIAKLLGRTNFEGIAGHYLRGHPPKSPVMMFYGQDFPKFLAGFEPVKHLGYLADVARLELALRGSYHAADATAIDPSKLQTMAPDALLKAGLSFAPAIRLIRSDWPIFDIWRYNTEVDAPKPSAVAQDILITRPEFDPAPHLLPHGGAIWIEALQQRNSFGASYDAATESFPDFDLSVVLNILIAGEAIRDINLKDTI
jgi:hypothetical protein